MKGPCLLILPGKTIAVPFCPSLAEPSRASVCWVWDAHIGLSARVGPPSPPCTQDCSHPYFTLCSNIHLPLMQSSLNSECSRELPMTFPSLSPSCFSTAQISETVNSWKTRIIFFSPSWFPQNPSHGSAHSRAAASLSLKASLPAFGPHNNLGQGPEATCKRSRPREGQWGPYPFIEALEEFYLICQGVHLGLEVNLVHVGSIHVLGNTESSQLLHFPLVFPPFLPPFLKPQVPYSLHSPTPCFSGRPHPWEQANQYAVQWCTRSVTNAGVSNWWILGAAYKRLGEKSRKIRIPVIPAQGTKVPFPQPSPQRAL